jgi:hypothetical protein
MKRIILAVLVLVGFVFAQGLGSDPQKVKDAYVDCTLYAQQLAMENAALKATLEIVKNDLARIKTVDQLDSLRIAYKIEKLEK